MCFLIVPDPVPFLEATATLQAKASKLADVEMEVKQLRDTLAEYNEEFRTVRNQGKPLSFSICIWLAGCLCALRARFQLDLPSIHRAVMAFIISIFTALLLFIFFSPGFHCVCIRLRFSHFFILRLISDSNMYTTQKKC